MSRGSVASRLDLGLLSFCILGDLPKGFPDGSDGKESACNAGDSGRLRSGRSPGEGSGYTLQYSCFFICKMGVTVV